MSYICGQNSIRNNMTHSENIKLAPVMVELNQSLKRFLSETIKKNDLSVSKSDLNLSNLLADRLLMVMAIKEGIPYIVFNNILRMSPFSTEEWSHLLSLSTKTMLRIKQTNSKFKSVQSERIMEVAEVTKMGMDMFDGPEQFKLWLETPNYALGRQKPMDLLSDSYGKELVMREMGRIDEGIFA
jgi:putative toxin-antitoxin system antitoxin component (TIGR02293 family)